ncbi:hypothetical protein N7530_002350 [Penicillium desertorum]|uniref:Uncharacterized protein n=1 Tax=Penicillium desertorum TaxID=1303715 RepID=A0A9W9X3C7_9EURO|nr:hypothetical protein N7530_002350 [Penicillium desertorum]
MCSSSQTEEGSARKKAPYGTTLRRTLRMEEVYVWKKALYGRLQMETHGDLIANPNSGGKCEISLLDVLFPVDGGL